MFNHKNIIILDLQIYYAFISSTKSKQEKVFHFVGNLIGK